MKWSDEMQEWCKSPRTQEAVKTFEDTTLKQMHNELLQACCKSTDPIVKGYHAAYAQTLHILAMMKGSHE